MTYTRPAHGDPTNDGSATDATVIVDALSDGLEAVEAVTGVRPESHGIVGNGTDEGTAWVAMLAALGAGSHTIVLTPGKTYRCDSQLTIPAGYFRITALSGSALDFNNATYPTDGPILDLRYGGSDAKVLCLQIGAIEIDHITVADLGTSSTPFILTTIAEPRIHDAYFVGNPGKLHTTCDQDVIILGGISQLQSAGNAASGFGGYGGYVRNNSFMRIRRAVVGRNFCNGIVIEGNAVDPTCGTNRAAVSAPTLNAPSTATTGGVLAAATYYYKVTALSAGETVASNEVSRVTTGSTSTVTLTWSAVSGVDGYRVYRSTSAGTETLLAELGAVTTYLDTGADTGTVVSICTPPASNGSGHDAPIVLDSGGWDAATLSHVQGNTIAGNTLEIQHYQHGVAMRNNARYNCLSSNGFWDPYGSSTYLSDVHVDEASGCIANNFGLTGYSHSPNPITGTTNGANSFHGTGRDCLIAGIRYPGFSAQVLSTGNVSFSSTSWASVAGVPDLAISAVPGDVVELNLQCMIANEANWLYLDGATVVSGSPVNYVAVQLTGSSHATSNGVISWIGPSSTWATPSGKVSYVVQAADVSADNLVRFRLVGRIETGVNKQIYATGDLPLTFSATRLTA